MVLVGAFLVVTIGASNGNGGGAGTYKIELDNAFGLVTGEDFKVAGVVAGSIKSIDLDRKTLRAIVTVQVAQRGFGSFRKDVFCESRPQSLIGEYFINCDPGTSSTMLAPGATIPVTHTSSTIPADLIQGIMRMPYRERLTLLINELGAGVAGRSGDLQAALDRAVPALDQTDNLLKLLGERLAHAAGPDRELERRDHGTREQLQAGGAVRDRGEQHRRRHRDAADRATPDVPEPPGLPGAAAARAREARFRHGRERACAREPERGLWPDRPAVHGSAAVLALRAAGDQIARSRVGNWPPGGNRGSADDRPPQRSSRPSTPELAQNLRIVLDDLDTQSRAVERDPRSPGGVGFSGLEALLGYVFNQTLAINTFGPYGHMLAVDAFVDLRCTPYATPSTIATNLKMFGAASYRQCYSWLGPNQPGVNEPDPTCTKANGCTSPCVPDPGGAPPGEKGPTTSACTLAAADTAGANTASKRTAASTHAGAGSGGGGGSGGAASPSAAAGGSSGGGSSSSGGSSGSSGGGTSLGNAIRGILGVLGLGGSGGSSGPSQSGASASSSNTSTTPSQTQRLLNYLLAS